MIERPGVPIEEPVTTESFRPKPLLTKDRLFIFNPANLQRIKGNNYGLPNQWVLYWYAPAIGVLLFVFSWFSVPTLQFPIRIGNEGIPLQGIVVAKEVHSGFKRSITYQITYRYEINGLSYQNTDNITREAYLLLNEGDNVPLRYLADHPEATQPTMSASKSEAESNLRLIEFVWLVYVAVVVFLIYGFWTNLRLATRGVLIDGRTDYASLGQQKKGGDYHLSLTYTFISPKTGKTIKGSESKVRNDLRHIPLPKWGTAIKVLYFSDRNFRVM